MKERWRLGDNLDEGEPEGFIGQRREEVWM